MKLWAFAFMLLFMMMQQQSIFENVKLKSIVQAFGPVSSFQPNRAVPRLPFYRRSCLHMLRSPRNKGRQDIKIPLLVLTDEENPKVIRPVEFPMPASHLPVTEMTTLNLYGTEITSAAHIRLMQATVATPERLFGYIVWKNPSNVDSQSDLIDAIGVACQIVSHSDTSPSPPKFPDMDQGDVSTTLDELSKMPPFDSSLSSSKFSDLDQGILPPLDVFGKVPSIADENSSVDRDSPSMSPPAGQVLFRGSFRFVVKRVESIFPYTVAVVDELVDEVETQQINSTEGKEQKEDVQSTSVDEDDEDEDDGCYTELSSQELTFRCLNSMQTLVKMRLQANPNMSLLEKEIIATFRSETESSLDTVELEHAEEMASLLEIFRAELVEMTDVYLRRYAIGMMMCEIGDISFEERCEALRTTDGIQRLQKLVAILEGKISLERAKNMAQQISESTDGDKRQLKVGQASLPPWSKHIKEGVKVEYYWNEELGWCLGTVKGKMKVLDEILVDVEFEGGDTHRLPFNGLEKARWRPA